MFYLCSSVESLNLSNFNTKRVTDMKSMFFRCSSLKGINLSSFNTRNVKDMRFIFNFCSSLQMENVVVKDQKIINELNAYFKQLLDKCNII